MKRVFGYVRVSTADQGASGLSLEAQRTKILAYALLHGLEVVGIVSEEASAGDLRHRPLFQDVITRIMQGEADGLVIHKLDRAFRSVRDALAVSDRLNRRGKVLYSITESLATDTALGKFFFTLMASLAELERGLISERTAIALAQKKKRGEALGGMLPYGFSKDGAGMLVENSEEQNNIAVMRRMRQTGVSFRRLPEALADRGILNRKGKRFNISQLHKLLAQEVSSSGRRGHPFEDDRDDKGGEL